MIEKLHLYQKEKNAVRELQYDQSDEVESSHQSEISYNDEDEEEKIEQVNQLVDHDDEPIAELVMSKNPVKSELLPIKENDLNQAFI